MGQTLVIHPGPLGDVLLAIPALRALRKRHGAGLILAAQTGVGELLHVLGAVDVRVRFDLLGLDRLFVDPLPDEARPELRGDAARPPAGVEERPGLAGTLRALGGMGGHVGAPHLICWFGSKDPTFARRLVEWVPGAIVAPPWRPDVPVWQHLLATIDEEPVAADREPLAVHPRLMADGRRALDAAGWDGEVPLVIVHPGSSGRGKRWPVEGYAEVLNAVRAAHRVAIVLHEGPSDREPVRALLPRLVGPVGVLDNPTLPTLAAALGHAHVFVGNDSGVSHLAAAVGAPSLVLFTSGMQAWAPWSRRAATTLVSTTDLYPADIDAVTAALMPLVP
jgi:ADP-heptose:LPS heptosyltransferase